LLDDANLVLATLPVRVATDPSSDSARLQLSAPRQLTVDDALATVCALLTPMVIAIKVVMSGASNSGLFKTAPLAQGDDLTLVLALP
jgi:hypothetical protein